MTVALTKETKNSTSLAKEAKSQPTWDQADFSWDDSAPATWDNPGVVLINETKNNISLTHEQKNA